MATLLKNNLSCSVCLELFQDPLLLSCGHSFCRSCLEEICREPGEEEPRCPLCRHRSSRQPAPNMDLRNATEAFQAFQEERRFNDHLQDDKIPLLEEQGNPFIVPSSPADLRIFMAGKTGSGKSAAANTILGRERFESRMSPKSVTKECGIDEVKSGEKTISVTDTPGVYDTDLSVKTFRQELEKCIYMTAPGPHVFLLVLSLGVRYSKEEKDAVQWIRDNFDKEALHYTMVLFTHTDGLKDTPLEQYVGESDDLKKLISDCGGRFHGFNNNDKNPNQVTLLLENIERMVESNRVSGREYYTNDMYKKAQKQIEKARRIKMAKDVGLGVASGAGLAAAAAGGVVIVVTELLVLPGLLIGAGAVLAVGGGVKLLTNKISEHRKSNDHRKNK